MQQEKTFQERLFTVMNDIDNKVSNIKKKAILFVGLSRVGKSTLYNWALRHPLKAERQNIIKLIQEVVQEKKEVVQRKVQKVQEKVQKSVAVTYVPQTVTTETAEVKTGYVSCTLIPNIVDFVRLGNDVSLVDMAGYGDSRDYIGTLGVSYSLKAVLQAVEQVKFVIVIEENTLRSYTTLQRTFSHFASMFNHANMTKDIKQQIFKSTSLLITQSIHFLRHLQMIDQCINQLNDPLITNIENKQFIIKLLDQIHFHNRYTEFKMAQVGFPPQQCDFFQRFQQNQWSYLNLKNIDQSKVINLPFDKQFKALTDLQQNKFNKGVQKRLNSYKQFAKIFANIFTQVLVVNNIHDIKIPYSSFFQQMDKFIKENDHYDTEKRIDLRDLLILQFFKPQKVTLLKLILRIKDIITFDDFENTRKNIKKTMNIFEQRIKQLIQVVSVIFCRNKNDYLKMLQVKYILLRGMREFYMLIQVAQRLVASSKNTIHDSFSGLFIQQIDQILTMFIQSFQINQEARIIFGSKNPSNFLENYLTSRESVYALEFFFEIYYYQFMLLEGQQKETFFQLQRDAKTIHAKYQYELCNYRQSTQYLLQAIQFQFKYEQNFKKRMSLDLSQRQMIEKAEIMYINQQIILDMILQNLLKMNKFDISLELSKKMKWIDSVCEIYELILSDKSINQQKKFNNLEQYSIFCMQHGRREKGMTLLQKLLQCQKSNFNEKKKIITMIQQAIRNQQNYKQIYMQFIDNYETVELQNDSIREILRNIKRSFFNNSNDYSQIIDITKDFLNSFEIKYLTQEELLTKYLQKRLNSEAIAAANGFTIKYLQPYQQLEKQQNNFKCYDKVEIRNREELKELGSKLLKILEAAAKAIPNSDEQRFIKIDIDKVTLDQQEITQKHMAIFLNKQQIKPTFEYATKTMKKIKKIAKQPHNKLFNLIQQSRNSFLDLTRHLQGHIQQKYNNSVEQQQIHALISLVYTNTKQLNDFLQRRHKQIFPNSGLITNELYDIFNLIRSRLMEKLNQHLQEEVKIMDRSVQQFSRSFGERMY